MTDQPNSLLATPPTRKLPKDAAPQNAAPQDASTDDAAAEAASTAKDQLDQSEKLAEDQPAETVEAAEAVEAVEAVALDTNQDAGIRAEDAPAEPTEPPTADLTLEQPSEVEQPIEAASTTTTTAAMPEPSESAEPAAVEPIAAEPATATAKTTATVDAAESSSLPALPRHQPIPPASEPMQYRAIGLVRGKYMPSEEQFTRGFILTEDEVLIDSVLLGRVMSLVKKHIDLEQSHLWVVYPRTRERDLELHMQIVGVWEPEKLNRTAGLEESDETSDEAETDDTVDQAATEDSVAENPVAENSEEAALEEAEDTLFTSETANGSALTEDLDDRYFSVRGEVVYQAEEEERLLVKIRRAPKPGETEGKAFKVALKGKLEGKALGYFWDLQVQRQNNELVVTEATQIGMVPPQKRGAGKRGKPPRRGAGGPPRRGGPGVGAPPRKRWQGSRDESRPVRNDRGDRSERTERPPSSSAPRQPISKPVKRRPKAEES
jgi:hypothetical protein